MRVLHLNDRLSCRGGADLHLRGVIDAQVQAGHDVLLAAGRRDAEAAAPCPTRIVEGLAAPDERPVDLPALVGATMPDVLHVHNVMNPAALEQAADLRAVATVQDHRCFCPGSGKLTVSGDVCRDLFGEERCAGCFPGSDAYLRVVLHRTRARLAALRRMRFVTVLSEYMRSELLLAGVDPGRICVVPPFVHGLCRPGPTGAPCVLGAGRLVASKGVFDVVEAWRRSGVGLPLVFAGTGSARAALEQQGVEVTGWLCREAMSNLLRRAVLLVMAPRWQEPFGIVGIEALWMGTPVVAWDSGGVREWYPGEPVPWGDVGALAEAIRRAVGSRPPPLPAKYDPGALMDELYRVYAAAQGSR